MFAPDADWRQMHYLALDAFDAFDGIDRACPRLNIFNRLYAVTFAVLDRTTSTEIEGWRGLQRCFRSSSSPGLSARAAQDRLILHFEEDLQLTWDSWSGVLNQVRTSSHAGLHPSLVPPRSCWLNEPVIQPEAPALGFF